MLRSLFSGITGLRQHQTMMDVVGNNIANVNTTGFKSSSVVFEDTLSQMVRSAGAPANELGGLNPAQIGLGVQLGGIGTNFGQGSAQNTSRSTDLMIQGDGFFVVRNGNEDVYTRAGDFTFDSDGRLVTNTGMIVQGWQGKGGVINADGELKDIVLPAGTVIPPKPTDTATIGGNISTDTTGDVTMSATAYDVAGNPHVLSIVMSPDGAGGFNVDATDTSDPNSTSTSGAISWPVEGQPGTATNPTVAFANGAGTMSIDLSTLTHFGGPKTVAVTNVNGYAAGSLQQFRISPDGTVIGIFSNGQKLPMAMIALANFNNPGGLEKIGNTAFRTTTNSGLPQVGTPGGGGRGVLLGGTLEMSNVDLAQEFTSLIVAQRGFQANSKVITTSDEMLQDLVNIKR